eukprot:11850951-Alexandrium_andersonii.AAC.1
MCIRDRPPRTRSGSVADVRVCPSGLGARAAYAAGCRICRVRVPPLVCMRFRSLQWTIASSRSTPVRGPWPSW